MDPAIDLHIGRRVSKRRKLLGLTQTRLADAVGACRQSIQQYECGGTRMSAGQLWKIAKALDVPVDYFYEGLPSHWRGWPRMRRSA